MRFAALVLLALLATNAHAQETNYTGHYLTGPFSGEGVFIEHVGTKSFLTYATYDGQGRATWLVMPDGRAQFNAATQRTEFTGPYYRVTRGDESPPSIRAVAVGTATWYPIGPDTVRLSLNPSSPSELPSTATIRRFRL